MAESAVSAVVGRIGNLAIQESSLLCAVTSEVEFLKDELARLQGFLKDADTKMRSGNESIAVCVSQIRDASYEAENIIEAAEYVKKRSMLKKGFMGAISRYARLPSDLVILHRVDAQVRRVWRKISLIKVSMSSLNVANIGSDVLEKSHIEDDVIIPQNIEDDAVVGFENEYRQIINNLVGQENNLSVVSLVAMGGSGKSTLARKVYTSPRIQDHFDTFVWVVVSQKFKSIDLLKDILKQILGCRDETRAINQMQESEVGKKIHDFLLQKRFLLVLDDVWEADSWRQINKTAEVFPDVNNGSRVILTTQSTNVARHIQRPTYVYNLKLLDEEKSWELFYSKALPSYKRFTICNLDKFEELGRELARKCNGLPLALTVLGGYLSKNLCIQAWSDILLGWTQAGNNKVTMREILAGSYNNLPNHYSKSCFLYLASFPQGCNISVSDLIELWTSEYFIRRTKKLKVHEIARMCVTELAQRSLVQIVGRNKAHGWIEEIRIHDILRDWCIQEAREDGFLDIIEGISSARSVSSTSSHAMTFYRCSFQDFCYDGISDATPTPNLRTLFGFGLSSMSPTMLRFLRVLHVENSSLKNFSREIGGCIHLRCLRLRRCEHVTLLSSIGQLLYLQTIDLRGTVLKSLAPSNLWAIPTLRHVYLNNVFSPPRSVQQKKLQTLYLDVPLGGGNYFGGGMVTFFGQMTQLTTLFLCVDPMPAEMIKIFASMPRLVDIYLHQFDVLNRLPDSHCFLQSLRQLCLFAHVIIEDPMPILEKLPCLVVLVLHGYEGQIMSCSSGGFPQLLDLELGMFSTEEWRMEVGAMPMLSHLKLRSCEKMCKLPEGLVHLLSLKELKLLDMPQISVDDITWKELHEKRCNVGDDAFVKQFSSCGFKSLCTH